MSEDIICECPVCGRQHRLLAENPPLAITGLTDEELSRLSRVFNETANLHQPQDERINEWLKLQLRQVRSLTPKDPA